MTEGPLHEKLARLAESEHQSEMDGMWFMGALAEHYQQGDLIARDDPRLVAMVDALQWYGDPTSYDRIEEFNNHHYVDADEGFFARLVLAEWEKKE